jgi:triacylglycerol lipase
VKYRLLLYCEMGTGARFAAAACAIAALCLGAAPAHAESVVEGPPGSNDFSCRPSAEHPRPVVLVHGLGASAPSNWGYIGPRLHDAGYCVFALSYGIDPRTQGLPYRPGGTISMEQSSKELKAFVKRVLEATGARRVDLVGHSEGTVMPRYYLERRGGAKRVKRFVAITPLWRGTNLAGIGFLAEEAAPYGLDQPLIDLVAGLCGSCPEFVQGSPFLDHLNADGEAIPGIRHTNIITRYDELVQPYTSGIMSDGGTNIVVQDVCPNDLSEHAAVAFDPVVARLVLNALDPPHAQPVAC